MTMIDFFEQVQNHTNPSSAILVETIRSLNFCRRKSGECFMGCLPLLYVWLWSHYQCQKSAFTKPYLSYRLPIKEFCDSEWLGPKTKKGWIAFLQNIYDKQILWFAPWMPHVPLLYRCGDKLWIPLPRL